MNWTNIVFKDTLPFTSPPIGYFNPIFTSKDLLHISNLTYSWPICNFGIPFLKLCRMFRVEDVFPNRQNTRASFKLLLHSQPPLLWLLNCSPCTFVYISYSETGLGRMRAQYSQQFVRVVLAFPFFFIHKTAVMLVFLLCHINRLQLFNDLMRQAILFICLFSF